MNEPQSEVTVPSGPLSHELSWLGDLLVPVVENLRTAETRYAEAMKEAEAAKAKEAIFRSQLENLLGLAGSNKLSPEDVIAYCEAVLRYRAYQASLPPEAFGKRRVSNAELMVIIARAIRQAGTPLDLEEIMRELEAQRIFLPGKDPRSNLLAYISRSPLVKTVKKGLYTFVPELLVAAENKLAVSEAELRLPFNRQEDK